MDVHEITGIVLKMWISLIPLAVHTMWPRPVQILQNNSLENIQSRVRLHNHPLAFWGRGLGTESICVCEEAGGWGGVG